MPLSLSILEITGKAFGAIRARHVALAQEASITLKDIKSAYMAGASGTYVDPVKAQRVGLVPPSTERIVQVGNTSLALARDLISKPELLDTLRAYAKQLRGKHIAFAVSDTFKRVYINELSYWTEGLPPSKYEELLKPYGIKVFSNLPPR